MNDSKRISKVTALLLVLIMGALSLAGCSGSKSSTAESTSAENTVSDSTTATPAAGDSKEALAAAKESGGAAADSSQITSGGDFVTYGTTEISNFDPYVSATADGRSLFFNIYEGLVKVTSNGSFEGAVAEKWDISEDAKTYTFTLRDGVKFHDESLVTAADVLASIQKAIETGATGYDKIKSFQALDDKTVEIILKEGSANFIPNLTAPVVKKDYEDNGTQPIGTGPFKLKSYTAQQNIVLEKFKAYWKTGYPYLDTVTIKFSTDTSASLLELQAGTVDSGSVTSETKATLDANEYDFIEVSSNAVQLLALNNTFEPFQNVKVRQAVNYLIDAGEIKALVNEYGINNGGGLIPGLKNYYNAELENAYPTDPNKAKQLLKEAGYKDGFSFTVKVPSVYQIHVDAAEVIKEELAKAGITLDIETVDWADWLQNVYQGRQYEATIISLDGATAAPESFLSRYVSDADNNFVNFAGTDYDEVYKKASTTLDEQERIRLFKEAQKILSEEAASVFIQDIASLVALNKKFTGYTTYPLYVTDYSTIHLAQ